MDRRARPWPGARARRPSRVPTHAGRPERRKAADGPFGLLAGFVGSRTLGIMAGS
ncbi:hypothetical protein ACQPZP_26270 [Spirillospora sp. CA-142024]|uniref:hypothetical protein n=1 Tax=Spirillospora sp. CA-142024 TaxID=3240036 RepID=UPI003D8C8D40